MSRAKRARDRPVVADRNADAAAANIAVKLTYLTSQIEQARENPRRFPEVLQMLPISPTKFNQWTSESIPTGLHAPAFRQNAAQTLRKHTNTRSSVDTAVAAVKRLRMAAREKTDQQEGKLEKVVTLKREIQLLKAMKEIAERELVRYQAKSEELQGQLRALKAQDEAKTREFEQAFSKLRRQLKEATDKKGDGSDARVVPIKRS